MTTTNPTSETIDGSGSDFSDWLAREMPPGTVISDPRWWAPRIAARFATTQPPRPAAPDLHAHLLDMLGVKTHEEAGAEIGRLHGIALAKASGSAPDGPEPLAECPISGLKFFANVEHPELGMIATYGGPLDSYTTPQLAEDDELRRERYDWDADHWIEGGEPFGYFYREQQAATPPASTPEPADRFNKIAAALMPFCSGNVSAAQMAHAVMDVIGAEASAPEVTEDRRPGLNETTHIATMTYTAQPNNVEAWRIGEACAKASPGGDPIDHGLSLLRELHLRGYGIVRINPLTAALTEKSHG